MVRIGPTRGHAIRCMDVHRLSNPSVSIVSCMGEIILGHIGFFVSVALAGVPIAGTFREIPLVGLVTNLRNRARDQS